MCGFGFLVTVAFCLANLLIVLNEKVKHVLSQAENIEMAHLLVKILMSHLQEREDGLVLHADVAASDAEKTLNLHASPRLMGMAELANAVWWMISLEGCVICMSSQHF